MKQILSLFQSEVEESATVNLTPLIDVVFVILILFILVAPLVELDRIELAPSGSQPKKQELSHQQERKIQIYVYKDNTICLNGSQISADQLKPKLAALRRLEPTLSPQIFQDREAFFGTYQIVKNALEEVGFETLDVILQPG